LAGLLQPQGGRGLRLLKRRLTLGRQLWYELLLISHLPSDPKTVVY
jgi:hypothetical protein